MVEDQELRRIVHDAVAAHMPAGKLERVAVESYLNSVNEEGLNVTIVIPDDDPLPIDGQGVLDIMLEVFDRLQEAGETRFPVLSFASEDELAHCGDTDS